MAMEIVGANRFGLCLIYLEAFFDCLVVVISATAGFAAVQKAFDNLIFFYEHVEEHSLHVATLQQELECFGLCYGAWKTIKDNTFAVLWQVVQIALNEVNHLMVWHKIAARNQLSNLFAEFAARFDFCAESVTC